MEVERRGVSGLRMRLKREGLGFCVGVGEIGGMEREGDGMGWDGMGRRMLRLALGGWFWQAEAEKV